MSQRYRILVADDSEDYVLLIRRAFEASQTAEFVAVLSDGRKVVDYFEGKGVFSDRKTYPIPDVLILDLKMPGLSGFEVLQALRTRDLPLPKRVAVLTNLARPEDIRRCFELGAHFITQKEADLTGFVQRLDHVMLNGGTSSRPE